MRSFPATIALLAALFGAGCTTSGSSISQLAPAAITEPALGFAPSSPSGAATAEAKSSLAAEVEGSADGAVAEEYVAVKSGKRASSLLAVSKIPAAAIEIASAPFVRADPVAGGKRDRECLMRAMYFESNRSSRDGQLAVGTVVMHRLAAGNWGKSVCGVVGAPRQFAPGVMTRRLQGDTTDLAALADAILAGKRHPTLKGNVMYFHQAGLRFPYRNMKYVLVAGGNTFYYKSSRRRG
jgi:hypothetical protein